MWLEAELDSVTSDERAGLEPGQQLPNFPKFQGAAWATYSWPVSFAGAGEMFLRGQASYMGETTTKLVPPQFLAANPPFTNSSYTVADLRLGLISSDGDWEINLFVNNVTDERAQVNQDNAAGEWAWGRSGQYEHSHNVYTVRPREYGIRVFARFGGD
jgi:outer membrane receptor protein involved in Fe transport